MADSQIGTGGTVPPGGIVGGLGVIPTAGDVILSIRDQIPDPVVGAGDDGTAFTLASLMRWLNDASRIVAVGSACIMDWYGVSTAEGMDTYILPSYIMSVEQAWYNLTPLTRSAELDDIFTTKVQGRSWWFGPHSAHAVPRLHVWPACDSTAATTFTIGTIGVDDQFFEIGSNFGFNSFGFMNIVDAATNTPELVMYRNIAATAPFMVTNVLRGQGGSRQAAHTGESMVREANLFFKCSRLPHPLALPSDPIEIPQPLWPLLELYVLSKVREAEQDHGAAADLRKEFQVMIQTLGSKGEMKGLRQGIQVRTNMPSTQLWQGHVYVR